MIQNTHPLRFKIVNQCPRFVTGIICNFAPKVFKQSGGWQSIVKMNVVLTTKSLQQESLFSLAISFPTLLDEAFRQIGDFQIVRNPSNKKINLLDQANCG